MDMSFGNKETLRAPYLISDRIFNHLRKVAGEP